MISLNAEVYPSVNYQKDIIRCLANFCHLSAFIEVREWIMENIKKLSEKRFSTYLIQRDTGLPLRSLYLC
jgi:hypothetical protein